MTTLDIYCVIKTVPELLGAVALFASALSFAGATSAAGHTMDVLRCVSILCLSCRSSKYQYLYIWY